MAHVMGTLPVTRGAAAAAYNLSSSSNKVRGKTCRAGVITLDAAGGHLTVCCVPQALHVGRPTPRRNSKAYRVQRQRAEVQVIPPVTLLSHHYHLTPMQRGLRALRPVVVVIQDLRAPQ